MRYGLFCQGMQVDNYATRQEAEAEKAKRPTTQDIDEDNPAAGTVQLSWTVSEVEE